MHSLLPGVSRWMLQGVTESIQSEQGVRLLSDHEKASEETGDGVARPSRAFRWFQYCTNSHRGRATKPSRQLHPTSYLDGIRGTAAFIVFLHHGTQAFLPSLRPGWGSYPNSYNPLALPIVRIIYSGGAMVSVFFVISGYVLSIKPLQLAAKAARQEHPASTGSIRFAAAYANIASSTFRRGPRLFIPCLFSTFLTGVLAMLGAFVEGENIGLQRYYQRADTWTEQLTRWFINSVVFINPFAGKHEFEENTWTIPIEFKGSLFVFLTVLGLAGRNKTLRRVCMFLSIAYWTWFGTWDSTQFLAGAAIADWRSTHFEEDDTEKTQSESQKSSLKSRIPYWISALCAVYLLSMPEGDENVSNSPGYVTLASILTPQSWKNHWGPGRWWPTWGAILFIATADQAGPQSILQRAFTTRFAQFLGDISFSLYLLHGITIYSVGVRLMNFVGEILGHDTDIGYVSSLLLSTGMTLVFLFWVSRVFTQVVDKGAVNLAKKMEAW